MNSSNNNENGMDHRRDSSTSSVRFADAAFSFTSSSPARRKSTQSQLINLSNLPQLVQPQRKTISFSGVSYVIDRLLDQNKADVEAREAIVSGNEQAIEDIKSSMDYEKIGALFKVRAVSICDFLGLSAN